MKILQVLFCCLSPPQRQLYQAYLHSRDVADILEGLRPAMEGITLLRKICNHADLLHRTELQVRVFSGSAVPDFRGCRWRKGVIGFWVHAGE